jgi:glycosyltransferase involved in cell wall biosynthesis
MDWLPNEDAVFYFAKRILPLIQQKIPETTLRVVGRRPSEHLRALGTRDGSVKVTGQVEDVRPHVQDASVYVVPLRVGGGTRLKIFEAMAMGKAVVSTSVGAEGLPVQHAKNIVIADDPEGFAREVVSLLHNDERRNDLGRAARELVEQHYSWACVAARFEHVLAKVVQRKPEAVSEQSHLITGRAACRQTFRQGSQDAESGKSPVMEGAKE